MQVNRMKKENKVLKPSEQKKLLLDRVREVKKMMPKNWRKRLVKRNPQYDSLEMADFISRIHATRAADETLTVIFEQIAADYAKELKRAKAKNEKSLTPKPVTS